MTPLNWAEVAGAVVVAAVVLRNLKGMHELTGAAPEAGQQGPSEVMWRWLKNDGETVHPGDNIAVTQVNAQEVEIQAHDHGTIHWVAAEGEMVPSGSILATIDQGSVSVPVVVPREYFER